MNIKIEVSHIFPWNLSTDYSTKFVINSYKHTFDILLIYEDLMKTWE